MFTSTALEIAVVHTYIQSDGGGGPPTNRLPPARPSLRSTCVLCKSVVPPRQTHQIREAQWRGCLHFGVAIFDFNNSTDCDHDAISSPPDDWPGPVDDDNAVLPTGSGWLCAGSILICRWFNWCGIIYGVFALARGRSNL